MSVLIANLIHNKYSIWTGFNTFKNQIIYQMIQSVKIFYIILILYQIISLNIPLLSQKTDSLSFSIYSRYSFYTFEKNAEILLHVPVSYSYKNISVYLKVNNDTLGTWNGIPKNSILRIPFALDLDPDNYKISANIKVSGSITRFIAFSDLIILKYKPNEVKTDRLTGGLIVNKRQFFPFGFYCYSPVHPTLPEEEAVRGFNMMSPYQKILPSTFDERKAYMDRCAQLGMKVHYNLLSVSGGGGVGSKPEGLSWSDRKTLLLNEIKTFRDHPALLAWYIADEPNGHKIPPDTLKFIYRLIRENDPWHPQSIVFMAPFLASRQYIDALDIVMADPYPIPDSPLTLPGNVAGSLSSEFKGKKPVWIVPQAFGGGELWSREPTVQEIRAMTYQSLINGAKGIQYFIRQGLNLFPKSTILWNECGRMALEISEMTPWLLSDEETIKITSSSKNVIVTSGVHNGQLLILAANKTNEPQTTKFSLAKPLSGKVRVLFENRYVTISNGSFSDQLSALGTQVYLMNLKALKETVKFWSDNLIKDPGFEDLSSPGIPASCYAWNNGDRGATFFIDSREHFEGNHSLRLTTPVNNCSAKLRFFPFAVRPGTTYYISVMAKADPDQISDTISRKTPHYFEISLGDYGYERFIPENEWKQFMAGFTIPYHKDLPPKVNVILQMPSAGVAWFDMLQAIEGVDIKRSINPELRFLSE